MSGAASIEKASAGDDEGVDHTCRNKMCHNPRHLEGVSSEENTRRRHEWARRRFAQGAIV